MTSPIEVQDIELCGKKYHCKASFSALVTIEQKAGVSLIKIFERYSQHDVRAIDVAAILYGCMKGADDNLPLSFEAVGDLVYEHGIGSLQLPAFMLVKDAFTGPKKKVTAILDGPVKE